MSDFTRFGKSSPFLAKGFARADVSEEDCSPGHEGVPSAHARNHRLFPSLAESFEDRQSNPLESSSRAPTAAQLLIAGSILTAGAHVALAQKHPDQILLKDYRPRSIFKIPETRVEKARYVGEDRWMYEPMDERNDGLMNGWKWKVSKEPGVLQHDEVVATLERAVKKHPRTVFIGCHFANCCSDLNMLGRMLDENANLYADIGARYAEISPIPRFVGQFFKRYEDRLFYGTDMDPEAEMYRVTFRILETQDEHFYPAYFSKYHWPMHALGLPDEVLRKVYRENALKLLGNGA